MAAVQNNPKYGTDIIDALQIITVEDPLNPGKTIEVFNMPLDLPTISNQIQELLLSTCKNHITKQTINGGSFIQVANVGITKKLHIERNEDGTIKKQGNKKVIWNKSNHYIKYQNELKELYRKQADIRKYQHECLANYIISLGNKVYVEKMNFAGLQKRAKNTEKNEKKISFSFLLHKNTPPFSAYAKENVLYLCDRVFLKITKNIKIPRIGHLVIDNG